MPQFPELPAAGKIDTGGFNPELGYSYQELASMSRSMHHSQGRGRCGIPGRARPISDLVEGAPAAHDPFDGVDTTWNRLPGGAAVGRLLEEALAAFQMEHPERSLPALAKARPLVAAMSDPLARAKLAELDQAIALCAGLYVEAQPSQPRVSPGGKLGVEVTAINRSHAAVRLESGAMEGIWNESLDVKPGPLATNQIVTIPFERNVPAGQPYTQPYWLVKPPTADFYQVDDRQLIGLADTPPAARVRLKLTVEGASIEVVRPVEDRYAPRAEGERERRLQVVPPVAVKMPDSVALFPSAAARAVRVSLHADVAKAQGAVRLDLPAGWRASPQSQPFQLAENEDQQATFTVTPPDADSTAELARRGHHCGA